jgi:serine/threonine-protein kinase
MEKPQPPPKDLPPNGDDTSALTQRPEATAANVDATQDFDTQAAASQAPAPGLSPGKTNVLGDYRLLKKLGQGGMGAVYKAHQISLDRPVAVKVMSKQLAAKPAFVHRFLREARVMARLDHPNIVRCFEVKEENGLHYLAMEYVDGGSVETWLRKLGKFSLGDALHIVLRTADALQHAHEEGLVHRDIKPDNILLTSKGVLKVADLGLAKRTDDDKSMTRTGTGAGTPVYMAPEQARDAKHVDARCDIYALGCMLYVFLTGEPPFRGETLVELTEAKEKEKHVPARRLNAEVPERLDLILDKMLARKLEHRHQSCAQVIEDLEALGKANDTLSFLQKEGAPAAAKSAGSRPLARPTSKPSTAKSAPAAPPPAAVEGEPNIWYAAFKTREGKKVTRKMTTDEILGAVKSGTFTADTQLSKTLQGGYRALATYPEFEPLLHAKTTQSKAEKKGEKFRELYKQIEREDQRRRRWRWLRNLFASFRSFVGLIIWLAIIVGVCIGVYFLIRWGWDSLGDKVQKSIN